MKAVTYSQYGPPDVLKIKEVAKPVPKDHEVLVKVVAVSLNPHEAHMRKGMLLARLMGGDGLLRPKETISGADFAGIIEQVGKDVVDFKVGDEVFGRRYPNGFAEYLTVSEKPIMWKPANITFEQAAGVQVAALTALQVLRDGGKLKPGQKVLVNGAAGGVGTFTVQIAKILGGEVTGVCSTRNVELVRSLGADRVIDYTRSDFTKERGCYDLIIDNVGNRATAQLLRALKPGGIAIMVGFTSVPLLLSHMVLGPVLARLGKKSHKSMVSKINKEDLFLLKEWMETGQLVPFVDKVFPLQEVVEAYRYLESKHASGKIVVSMA